MIAMFMGLTYTGVVVNKLVHTSVDTATCNGRIELWEEGGRNPIVAFPLTGLQPCPRLMVPTATNWGLIGLAVVLLVGGTWLLRRRRAFAESLALL